ncbi:MAG: fatty acid hydroxylase [Hyphomonadaceae bacterium]|nr:MAG: fatty acid hydroxylase [Hyphomonadaceae bacterium]KAF0184229.1 MAG: fatty acid hydroxylase [Hyphomonadaceae bacterium]
MNIEATIRLSIFIGVFALMALWEMFAPRRVQGFSKPIRFANNIGIMALNTVILRFAFPLGAGGVALYCQLHGIGLFNLVKAPILLEFLLGLALLDLVIYFQHVAFHKFPLLWRLHQVHHCDPEFDVSTSGRFHVFEILLSMLIKIAAIAIIGPSALAVLVFEIVLNACAMFNHSNVRISPKIDALLRGFIVTPDMHRVHHSQIVPEQNSNFGFNIPWWDRLFKTYMAQPELGHEGMKIGLDEVQTTRDLWIDKLLWRVFK